MPISDTKMPFGKHKGQDLDDVPASYLLWFYEQDWAMQYPEVLKYVKKNIQAIKEDALYQEEEFDPY